MGNFSLTTRFLILGMLIWIIFYPVNMKVSPSEQGVKPLPVVKEQTLWVQVPPVSLGHPHGSDLIKFKNQQQPSVPPNMLTMRHVSQIQLINNNTKLWASDPHMISGLRAQNNNHEVLEIITQRDISPTVSTAYNISVGDNKFPDTRKESTTNGTYGTKETYAEALFEYDQIINTRQTSKPYSQQLQGHTTLKNLRIKLFLWAYLGERVRHETNNTHNMTDTARTHHGNE